MIKKLYSILPSSVINNLKKIRPLYEAVKKIKGIRNVYSNLGRSVFLNSRRSIWDILVYYSLKRKDRYAYAQKLYYRYHYKIADYYRSVKKDTVVGSYDLHNKWADYDDYMMKYIDDGYKEKTALDFGCGPGRNIIKYNKSFKRIDGADISSEGIMNAKKNFAYHNFTKESRFYVTSGKNLGDVLADYYDFIFSSITMQHICVWETRYSIFESMYRSLKNGGRISIQMGYGEKCPATVGYYENCYAALQTNKACDTRVENPEQLKKDLEEIRFRDFEYWIRPVGPGDNHLNWIFFTATK
ncbi:MAG: class I SAM-dependent methyltransferase [Candidatus Omnitrophica bacterium]|nr:class I SAM-dependent methyltransferase [Candidatus Omnitrophota bacterium]